MTPRKLIPQPIYLAPERAEALDKLSEETRIPKAVLLREAVDDLLALHVRDDFSARVRALRGALKIARSQLLLYRREIDLKKLGLIPQQNCQKAIDAIDKALEEFGD